MNSDQFTVSQEGPKTEPPLPDKKVERASGRWVVLVAGVVFFLIFLPFMDRPWGLHAAILAAYSVLAFGIALTGGERSPARLETRQQIPKLLSVHTVALVMVSLTVSAWLRLQTELPTAIVERGRKGSWWDLALELTLMVACIWQGLWMRGVLQRSVRDSKN